jgi:hypothetical protein
MYDTTFEHVAGIDNLVADALSRLDANFEKDIKSPTQNEQGIFHAFCMSQLNSEEETLSEFVNQPDSLDISCSFMLNRETECDFSLYPPMIVKYQKQDKKLKTSMLKTKTEDYTTKLVEGAELIMHYLGEPLYPNNSNHGL